MDTLRINLNERSYPILIGAGILQDAALLQTHITAKDLLIVTNERVAPLYLARLRSALSQHRVSEVVLPDGEAHKTLATLSHVLDACVSARLNRDAAVVALGGGVVGDIAGFAAACYQRGVDYVQIPTTLLAQVDSSVGGKTGVNHQQGKNLIGAFHQPRCVIADTTVLNTLPDRELSAGLAEVIKYGLIREAAFFAWLEGHYAALLQRDATALTYAIKNSCAQKAAIVSLDEREQGLRALLNLGHTFGHAIENAVGYGTWLHGEAVAAGMLLAADMSVRLGWLATADYVRIEHLLQACKLPVQPPKISAKRAAELVAVDKKVLAGQLRLILLRAIGEAVITADYDPKILQTTLDHGFN